MNKTKVFPFQCSNPDCNEEYDLNRFLGVYSLWGYIFLTNMDSSIVGLTCPTCKHTTINRYTGLPADFVYQNFDNIIAKRPLNIQEQFQRIFYVKFPAEFFPSLVEPTLAKDIVYGIPPNFQPIQKSTELDQYESGISDSNIEKLVEFENTQNVKVFSRIVPFHSVYYFADVWLRSYSDLTSEVMEQWHNSLESLYTNGFRLKGDRPYKGLIKNDLSQDDFDNMDRHLDAWDTEVFKNRVQKLISEYREFRSRKDFELVCYNELINKWAREFYYNPGLIKKRHDENEEFSLAMYEHGEPHDGDENCAFDTSSEEDLVPDVNPHPTQYFGFQQPAQCSPTQTITAPHADVILRLNQKHAIVDYSGQILVMNENYDPSLERQYQTFSKKTDFFDRYANRQMQDPDNPKKQITEAQFWWKHPARRSYEGIIFSPGRDVPGYYNLWKGLAAKAIPGNWSYFKNHIYNIIACGNQEIFHWIMSWMARIVQDPGGDKPGTSIVLRGGQGTGKTFFARMFGSLFGRHYLYLSNSSHLTGQFNHHLRDALVVFVDEGFLVGDKKSEGLLKSMVTEQVLNIEQKFRDLTTVKNHINLIIASNNENIVPAGVDERRFFVTDISEAQKQNKAYFEAIEQQMKTGGREAMLFDLLNWRYDLNILRTIPRTKALFDQKYNSMGTVQKFWYEVLQDGRLSKTHQAWDGIVSFQELHQSYLEFSKALNHKHTLAETTFGRELQKLCKSMTKSKTNRDGVRCHIKKFPPLETCRKEFELYLGMPGLVLWDDSPGAEQIHDNTHLNKVIM